MQLKVLPTLGDNYMYVVSDGSHAVAIDPAVGRSVLKAAEDMGVRIEYILLTHHHLDHTGGCREILAEMGCKIVGPHDMRLPLVDYQVEEEDVVQVGRLNMHTIAVPGHTRSHVAYYCPEFGAVWTGDTLFVGGCGRVFEESHARMWTSLCKLRELPGDTAVYCGHNYTVENLEFAHHLEPRNEAVTRRLDECRLLQRSGRPTVPSRLEQEQRTNPFLRSDDPAFCETVGLSGQEPGQVFRAIRKMKDRW